MWEQLKLENSTSVDEDFLLSELCSNSNSHSSFLSSYYPWKYWCTIQDDTEWMEIIFKDALEDPSANWDTGNANMKHILPCPSAPKGPKRKSESDINERRPKESPTWNLYLSDAE